MIEIEKLAIVSKELYDGLDGAIKALGGEDLGENDTESVFYHSDTQRLKVQNKTSKGAAKIAWKSGSSLEGVSQRREVELAITPSEVEHAIELMEAMLNVDYEKIVCNQKRHDYRMPNGIELAVKYSDDYGYHVELDRNIPEGEDAAKTEQAIAEVAEELGLRLMSDDEERDFLADALAKRKAA